MMAFLGLEFGNFNWYCYIDFRQLNCSQKALRLVDDLEIGGLELQLEGLEHGLLLELRMHVIMCCSTQVLCCITQKVVKLFSAVNFQQVIRIGLPMQNAAPSHHVRRIASCRLNYLGSVGSIYEFLKTRPNRSMESRIGWLSSLNFDFRSTHSKIKVNR